MYRERESQREREREREIAKGVTSTGPTLKPS